MTELAYVSISVQTEVTFAVVSFPSSQVKVASCLKTLAAQH